MLTHAHQRRLSRDDWKDGQMVRFSCTNYRTNEHIYGGWTGGRWDGQRTDGRTDGRMDELAD